MKNVAKSVLAWILASAIIGFWPLYYTLGNAFMTELTTRLVAGICLAITIQWFSEGLVSFRRGRRASDFVILGVVVGMMMTFLHRETVNTFRSLDMSDWLMASPILPLVVWMMAFGFSVLLIAKGTKAGVIPAENFGWLAFAVIYGVGFAILATVLT